MKRQDDVIEIESFRGRGKERGEREREMVDGEREREGREREREGERPGGGGARKQGERQFDNICVTNILKEMESGEIRGITENETKRNLYHQALL